ncbi:hypothetical protein [Spirochaeta isovalerica]|uniref:Uncharacterized protein n=1 Tax=Spirochaeta isovalerica TaxID=150 RepID=A0A841RFH4_9SPIO|nr:hypothetical protein [Spirochaeta isovalerica]MBB6481328.1 hypothetical protein [Spirochaeta isovalerica]
MLKKLHHLWSDEYNNEIRLLNLSINELDLIDRMSLHLKDRKRKILLLKNRNTFEKALSLVSNNEKDPTPYARELKEKLFGIKFEKSKDGIPTQLITETGEVFTGYLIDRKGQKLKIGNISKSSEKRNPGKNRIYIQNFYSLESHLVRTVLLLGDEAVIEIDERKNSIADRGFLKDVSIYIPGHEHPEKTRMKLLPGNKALIENPGRKLKAGDAFKLSVKRDAHGISWINAVVTSVSLNGKLARIRFGYLKKQ